MLEFGLQLFQAEGLAGNLQSFASDSSGELAPDLVGQRLDQLASPTRRETPERP